MAGPYYVSPAGSDSNNGLGPDASHASNKPFLTIGKLLAASGALASGETAYIAPGVYRETVTVGITSPTAETKIIGDPLNTKGFKDGSGNVLTPAPVRWTARTTDDKTASAAASLLTLAGRDYLTFQNIFIDGPANGSNNCVTTSTSQSTNIKFERCVLVVPSGIASGGRPINIASGTALVGVALDWTIDKCILICYGGAPISISHTSSATGADWNLNFVVKNSLLFSFGSTGGGVILARSGSSTFVAGGVKLSNCLVASSRSCVSTSGASSTTYPVTVYNCTLMNGGTEAIVSAANSGEIVEDYNVFAGITARQNVSAGSNSVTSYDPLMEWGQSWLFGFLPRMPFSPTCDSPLLGFGSDASVSLAEDMLGRARPSGAGPTWASALKAVGALEYHDFGIENTSVADGGSGSCVQLTGPGDHEFLVPVDTASTTLAVKVRYDSATYGGTDYPQVELVAAPEIGISAETKTATASASDAWETLTFSAFTASRKAWVVLRFKNRSTAGSGKAYLDTLSAT